jgi:hypothetical protein
MFIRIKSITVLLLIVLVTGASAGMREMALSTAVPGLGQLSGGSTRGKIVGLSFMGAEVVALHLLFNQVSQYNSLCQETENLQKQMTVETNSGYDKLMVARANWKKCYTDAQEAKKMVMPLVGIAVGIWALNVVEVYMFPPVSQEAPAAPSPEDKTSSLRNTIDCQLVCRNAQPQLFFTYSF